jgi:hypothetical protein
MELFLNFLWVLIAVFGLSVWRVCWAPGRSGRREPLHEWTAAVAALVFLFFAVSLSDDLHSNLVLFEESASGRRQAVVLASVHSAAHPGTKEVAACSLAVLPRVTWVHRLYPIGYLAPFKQSSLPLSRTDLRFGRAPPLTSL